MSARLLARTGAVLARIDQTLDDPFPAAVARLAGVPAGAWYCHRLDVVTVGARWIAEDDPLCDYRHGIEFECPDADGDPEDLYADRCWGGHWCLAEATTDIGLCDRHHAEIVTGASSDADADAVAFLLEHVPGLADRIAETLRPITVWWSSLDDDQRDAIFAPDPATEENPTT